METQYQKEWTTALPREAHGTAHEDPRPRSRSNHEELTQVKVRRHLKKTGERPPLIFLGRLQDLAIQEFTGMATVLKSKNLTSSIKDLEGDTAWRQQISQGILSRAEMTAWADLFPRERWRSAHHLYFLLQPILLERTSVWEGA